MHSKYEKSIYTILYKDATWLYEQRYEMNLFIAYREGIKDQRCIRMGEGGTENNFIPNHWAVIVPSASRGIVGWLKKLIKNPKITFWKRYF